MKKLIMHSMRNKTANFFIFFLTVSLLINPVLNQLQARGTHNGDDDIHVSYIGSSGNRPIFLIKFYNKDKQYEQLHISNKEGLVLYKEKLTIENFSKHFTMDLPSAESFDLILSFTNKKGKQIRKYVVSSNVLFVRNVEVTKL